MSATRFLVIAVFATIIGGSAHAEYNRISPPSASEQERVRINLDPAQSGRAYRDDNVDILRQRESGEYRKIESAGQDSGKFQSGRRIESAEIVDFNEHLSSYEWARRNWKLLFAVLVVVVGGYVLVFRR
ncbi:MAG: hypothetical protein SGI86_06100 [Deltaproteobacteria bacterium]|nr:hypothetical protein [Deltaproteobacteria bacterium]